MANNFLLKKAIEISLWWRRGGSYFLFLYNKMSKLRSSLIILIKL